MNEIIYLEQDEEIPSVIDKLRNLSAKSAVLVVPKGAAVLQSVVNLKILKKQTEELEKEIALVTQDKIGRNLASQVGLSVYDSVESPRPVLQSPRAEPEVSETIELDMSEKPPIKPPAGIAIHDYQKEKVITARPLSGSDYFPVSVPTQTSPFAKTPADTEIMAGRSRGEPTHTLSPTFPHSARLKKKSRISLFLFSLIFLITILLLYGYYPRAEVWLTLQSTSYQKEITMVVDNNIDKLAFDRSAIPGELQEIEKEAKETYSATGSKDIGEKASGTIKMTNPTGDSHTITTGTEFKSSAGLLFLASESVTIPKATASVDALGNVIKNSGTANVKVQAKESGENYNVTVSNFTVIGNSLLSAESTAAMSGGSSKKITILSQDDINQAKDQLREKLAQANFQELKNKAGEQIINNSSISNEVITFETNQKVGEETTNFEATLKLKSRTLAFWEKDYRQMIAEVLSQGLSSDQELILSPTDEIDTIVSQPDYSTGTMNLSGTITTNIVKKLDTEAIKQQIIKKKPSQAEDQLETLANVTGVQIKLRPSWWWRIPSNIEIKKEVK